MEGFEQRSVTGEGTGEFDHGSCSAAAFTGFDRRRILAACDSFQEECLTVVEHSSEQARRSGTATTPDAVGPRPSTSWPLAAGFRWFLGIVGLGGSLSLGEQPATFLHGFGMGGLGLLPVVEPTAFDPGLLTAGVGGEG